MLEHEVGHDVVGFDGFGKGRVVPEGVGQGVEDDEMGIDAGVEVGAVEVGGAAEEQVAPLVMKRVGGRPWRSA